MTLAEQFKENAYEAIKFIANNDCKLECIDSLFSDNWHPGTLRDFLKYVCGAPNDKSFYTYYMNFWRIKTDAAPEELDSLLRLNSATEP